MNTPLFDAAIAAIDACNAKDPRQAHDEQGYALPYELLYSQRMSATLQRFVPDAPESLQLAARAQHIERWILPREDYPMDREGYLAWRNALKQHHASRVKAFSGRLSVDSGPGRGCRLEVQFPHIEDCEIPVLEARNH